jgi:hypothetical protein
MDLILAFKKYFLNIKFVLLTSILFIFTLFAINPLFKITGGSLDVTYNLLLENPISIFITLLAITTFTLIFSLLQTIIIYRVEDSYAFEKYSFSEIKNSFKELFQFNIIYYLLIILLSSFLYEYKLLDNIFINFILFVISLLFWFIPQIIILEKEKAAHALIINYNYIKRNYLYLIYLFISCFILIIITYILDIIFGVFGGTIISTVFFVLFVIPFIEILKTEIYLDKYNLLKPQER